MRNKQKTELTKLWKQIQDLFLYVPIVRLGLEDFNLILTSYPKEMHEHYRNHGIEYSKNKMIYLINYDKSLSTLK